MYSINHSTGMMGVVFTKTELVFYPPNQRLQPHWTRSQITIRDCDHSTQDLRLQPHCTQSDMGLLFTWLVVTITLHTGITTTWRTIWLTMLRTIRDYEHIAHDERISPHWAQSDITNTLHTIRFYEHIAHNERIWPHCTLLENMTTMRQIKD